MSRKRILFISNLFPNPRAPNMAQFNRQQIESLYNICDIDVIAPIPWTSKLSNSLTYQYQNKGVWIFHPTYFYTPGCLRSYYGYFFYWSIRSVAYRLLAKNRYDVIFASWLYPDGWAAAKLAAEFKLTFNVKVHGTDVNRLADLGLITNKSMAVVKSASKIICVSNALKMRLLELGCPECKLVVLYNGVNSSIFRPLSKIDLRKSFGIGAEAKVLLYVGNLKEDKGLKELLLSFKKLVDSDPLWQLVLIGKGPYEQKFKDLLVSEKVNGVVKLLGSNELGDIAKWMNVASVLCLPSYNEGIPNVILEALSCGTRVVATNVGGIPELDNGTGMLKLVPPKTVDALVQALASIVELERLDTSLPEYISSWEQNAKKLFSVITC